MHIPYMEVDRNVKHKRNKGYKGQGRSPIREANMGKAWASKVGRKNK